MVAYLIVKSSVVLFSGRSVDSTDSIESTERIELLNSVRIVGTKSHGKMFFHHRESNLHVRGYGQSQ